MIEQPGMQTWRAASGKPSGEQQKRGCGQAWQDNTQRSQADTQTSHKQVEPTGRAGCRIHGIFVIRRFMLFSISPVFVNGKATDL